MLFNSFSFFVFFPVAVLVYLLIPKKIRELWLLMVSSFFYLFQNPKYFLFLSISIATTYTTGRLLYKIRNKNNWAIEKIKKVSLMIFVFCILLNFGMLFSFKYLSFFGTLVERFAAFFSLEITIPAFSFLLPLGISFYTFQAIGYVIDVYRGKYIPEKNIIRYSLFVSFFPLIVSGPIARGNQVLPQFEKLKKMNLWSYDRITSGVSMMLWGYFMKMVIADRIAVFVNGVYATYKEQSGLLLIVAAILFSIQIYCDFAGCSEMAIGAARIMGIEVNENFKAPYFSKSIREFWHRWHISLSTWFRDYVYIPMGGGRCHPVRKHINILFTFILSGVWHGASLHFFVWGFIHGFFQVLEDLLTPVSKKIEDKFRVKTDCFSYRWTKQMMTFLLVTIAWVFFRAQSVGEAIRYLYYAVIHFQMESLFDGSLFRVGLAQSEMVILLFAVLIFIIFDHIKYKNNEKLDEVLGRQNLLFRWMFYLGLFFSILIFGVYGPDYAACQFIYVQF